MYRILGCAALVHKRPTVSKILTLPYAANPQPEELFDHFPSKKSIKCLIKMPEGVYEGNTIIIKGSVPSNAIRFSINLQCGPSISMTDREDIAFHLNPRFNNNTVALNHLVDNEWGLEESFGGMPFSEGTFELEIVCDESAFKVNVQGKRFCEFTHRVPYTRIKALTVDGDVNITTYELLPKKEEVDISKISQVQDPEESIPTTVKNNV
ncbi:hypothetical protein B5X24_HaOG208479 [Helicoverpa armigera]|uniref:Galectin n=1 Tax=Helicoverpa armigera TaxID=29058 RepID=A0A2W1BQH3_HELAM|nr:hypothetical protein B5X24_HaOG208479 [Helicoverpa armigera]